MDVNDHTVNIRHRYHHGNLRAALLRAGLELLASRDTADLSLREVARKVGVSANAVYRHFPDRQALLVGLAAEGLRRLGAAQRMAAEASGGDAMAFAATGKAYVRFAIDNTALFRLIFSHTWRDRPGLDGQNEPAMLLRASVAARATNEKEAEKLALRAWSLAHGLAMLILDGQLEFGDALLELVLDPAIHADGKS